MILKSKSLGFSLIELVVVVLVIGVLAAVAVPAYQSYIVRVKVSEAYTMINVITNMQIRYFVEKGEFLNSVQLLPQYLDSPMTIQTTSGWDQLGYPAPINSNVYFSYKAPAGKVDQSGTEVYQPIDTISGLGFVKLDQDDLLARSYSSGQKCNTDAVTPAIVGAALQPSYDWAVITAVGDLNADRKEENGCTALMRLIEVSPATAKKPSSGGFLLLNMGE